MSTPKTKTNIVNDAARAIVSEVEKLTGMELPLLFCVNLCQVIYTVVEDVKAVEHKGKCCGGKCKS